MSHKHSRAVIEAQGLTAKAKLVLLDLADRADPKGRCWPRQATIADRTGLSPRTVWAALNELEANGWICRERRYRPNDGSRTSDMITVRDLQGAAEHVAATLQLPLMRVIGTSAGPGAVPLSAYPQDLRVGLVARPAKQEPINQTEESNLPKIAKTA